jgi:GT2 family glycosyltransferase
MTFSPSWSLAPPPQPRLAVPLPRQLDQTRVIACVPTTNSEPDSRTMEALRALGIQATSVVRDRRHQGAAWARNRAAARAPDTDWILFVDDGVIVSRSLIDSARGAIDSERPSAAVCGDVLFRGSCTSEWYNRHRTLLPPSGPEGDPATLTTAAVLIATQAFRAIGGFDEQFPSAGAEDFDLGFRLLGAGRIAHASDEWAVHQEDLDDAAAERALIERFRRYGRGWSILTKKWHLGAPAPISPMDPITPEERRLSALANEAFHSGLSQGS